MTIKTLIRKVKKPQERVHLLMTVEKKNDRVFHICIDIEDLQGNESGRNQHKNNPTMIQEQNNPLTLNDITSKPSLTSIFIMLDAQFGTGKSDRIERAAN